MCAHGARSQPVVEGVHGVNHVTVSAWAGSTNFGDELLLFALISKLRSRGVVVEAISTRPRLTERAHGVRAVSHRDLLAVDRTVRAGAALVVGGGGLLQDETSPLNLPYHLSRAWLARARKIPFAGIGLGAGPLRTRLGRGQVRRALRGAVGIAVRDGTNALRALRPPGTGADDVDRHSA